jgi:hypothetical protein
MPHMPSTEIIYMTEKGREIIHTRDTDIFQVEAMEVFIHLG